MFVEFGDIRKTFFSKIFPKDIYGTCPENIVLKKSNLITLLQFQNDGISLKLFLLVSDN